MRKSRASTYATAIAKKFEENTGVLPRAFTSNPGAYYGIQSALIQSAVTKNQMANREVWDFIVWWFNARFEVKGCPWNAAHIFSDSEIARYRKWRLANPNMAAEDVSPQVQVQAPPRDSDGSIERRLLSAR